MLESLTEAKARIAEIRSHFRSYGPGGIVHVAPHAVADDAVDRADGAGTQTFSAYLSSQMGSDAVHADSSEGAARGPAEYDDMIEKACAASDMDPALVKAVIKAESGFNARAVSSSGAQGLMQLMPNTARALGVSDPFNANQNVVGGVRYLKGQIERFGDVKLALAAYNAGPAAVIRYGGVPPYRETQRYVNRVLSYREQFSSPALNVRGPKSNG